GFQRGTSVEFMHPRTDALPRRLPSFFFSSRRRHTRFSRDWSSDVCSSDLVPVLRLEQRVYGSWQEASERGCDQSSNWWRGLRSEERERSFESDGRRRGNEVPYRKKTCGHAGLMHTYRT